VRGARVAKREKDLGERIQSYEKKAEKLVVLAVERPDQLTETEKKMKGLINKIKADQVRPHRLLALFPHELAHPHVL
jgi:vacuolar-type H+-ATPase subunit H